MNNLIEKYLSKPKLNYFVNNKTLFIQSISVPEELQRQGLATKEILDTIKREKVQFLTHSTTSIEGKLLFQSLEDKGILIKTGWEEYTKAMVKKKPMGTYKINWKKIK